MMTVDAPVQEAINGGVYRRRDQIQVYARTKLLPPESIALVRYRDDIQGGRVLDLGCGAGRLAVYFRPLVEDYVGLDVSRHMVEHCQETFPGFEFVQGDMRSLNPLEDGAFDSVFAISNLFDAVSHEDRLRVLAEVRRVLAPRGLLVFSSHNRDYFQAGAGPRLERHRNPLTQLRAFVDYLSACAHHRRIKAHHRFEPSYALLNDSGNNYRSLHYYIRSQVQAEQLSDAGFELLECLDSRGLTMDVTQRNPAEQSITYVARRCD